MTYVSRRDQTPAPIALSREELIAMAREADPFGDDGRLVSLADFQIDTAPTAGVGLNF